MAKNSFSSPKGGKRGCLCADGTYSAQCCDGELISQGVGALVSQGVSSVTNVNEERVVTNVSN
jgi:hypothetical protein